MGWMEGICQVIDSGLLHSCYYNGKAILDVERAILYSVWIGNVIGVCPFLSRQPSRDFTFAILTFLGL